mmetsp:Transcript_24096/g.56212  ORF Transcript_24096/g.56212 Transcript_24096/m.56212 type:complete len:117 (+) Transcript_24096:48-398(+)
MSMDMETQKTTMRDVMVHALACERYSNLDIGQTISVCGSEANSCCPVATSRTAKAFIGWVISGKAVSLQKLQEPRPDISADFNRHASNKEIQMQPRKPQTGKVGNLHWNRSRQPIA